MEIVIIPCSHKKSGEGGHEYHASPLMSSVLSPSNLEKLLQARLDLSHLLGLSPGLDLGSEYNDSNLRFLPAYSRYKGIVYSASKLSAAFPKAQSLQILIISALYGLLEGRDQIRDYDLTMNNTLPNGMRVKTWWKHKGLGTIVAEYIQKTSSIQVYDLLSGHYRDALHPWPPTSIKAITKLYDYPRQGQGSSWSRGKELKNILAAHTQE